MPEQYTITGIITPSDGLERAGLRVQAFDRDLPSLERRQGAALSMLGEAVADAEGRFQITYTLEQFRAGEARPILLRIGAPNADLSFRVFDQSGQELSIRSIEALNRSFGPDQIIFNAPAFVDVSLFVEVARPGGDSEYEQLAALIAPVLEDLPLVELSDEDVVFLIHELGLEQQPEVQQRIEWLRRCVLLAAEAGLPPEAFYGWGRTGLPAAFEELAAVPLRELQTVLTKLLAENDDTLRGRLQTAISDRIIPDLGDDRIQAIVRQLKRREQVLRQATAQLQDAETGAALVGYTVTTFDQDAGGENRGLDITDGEGKFLFDFFLPRDLPADAPARKFSFRVITPDGEAIPESGPIEINPNRLEPEVVFVKVDLPGPQAPPFEDQLQQAQLQTPPELLEWFRGQEIHALADIRRKGGLSHFANLPEVDPTIIRQLESLADLDRVSPTIQASKALLEKGFDSVLAIADAPRSEFINIFADRETGLTALEVAGLHVMATVQTHLLNNILAGMAADTANGFQPPALTGENQ